MQVLHRPGQSAPIRPLPLSPADGSTVDKDQFLDALRDHTNVDVPTTNVRQIPVLDDQAFVEGSVCLKRTWCGNRRRDVPKPARFDRASKGWRIAMWFTRRGCRELGKDRAGPSSLVTTTNAPGSRSAHGTLAGHQILRGWAPGMMVGDESVRRSAVDGRSRMSLVGQAPPCRKPDR
jgi:hypothetical protein